LKQNGKEIGLSGLRTSQIKARIQCEDRGTVATASCLRYQAVYIISAGLRCNSYQDGGIVRDAGGKLFQLNPVAVQIFQGLINGKAVAEIAKEVAHQFEVSIEDAASDVSEFLKSLEQHNLVSRTTEDHTNDC
jgi:hypothetical protein